VSTPLAFAPNSPNATINVAVTASSQALGPLKVSSTSQVRFVNSGTQTVFIDVVSAAASAPTATAATSMPMLPNTVEVFSVPQGAQIAVIAAATGSTLYATVGDGM
jgi:hypothetical protein